MAQTIVRIITGRTGRHLPEYGGLSRVWTSGIMAAYHRTHHRTVTEKQIRKYLSGKVALPHQLVASYSAAGYDHVLDDMRGIANTCASLHRLRAIQAEVRSALPPDTQADLDTYNFECANREQIAVYLAHALCSA